MAPPSCINRQRQTRRGSPCPKDIRSQFTDDFHSDYSSANRGSRKTISSSSRLLCSEDEDVQENSRHGPLRPHRRAAAAARRQAGAGSGAGAAVDPYAAAQPADAIEPINAVPLNAIAPRPRRVPAPPAISKVPEEPACLREHILPALGLRADLPVHFIHEKRVTDTDLNAQHNRFRIPSEGASGELLLSRWSSSSGTIVKGGGYMDFIRRCSFKEHDVVDIWAFKQRALRLFGKTMVHDSQLHFFIVKRDDTQLQ